ncbi:hypothetical protein [Clostridium perfringens]|uniref:hypothetical protein n=1 Tax=Clostridium perfringens TaxID=1502 RepID=UPI0007111985|nr:hypothetical protein [Clostridium perfringens]AQW28389.1 hypothetical protein BXT94_16765 [Clostridium perfringens]MDM0935884.1 hypothetical protein [Clostridium perfringens]
MSFINDTDTDNFIAPTEEASDAVKTSAFEPFSSIIFSGNIVAAFILVELNMVKLLVNVLLKLMLKLNF